MLEVVADRQARGEDFASLRLADADTPDLALLTELSTATRGSRHVPED